MRCTAWSGEASSELKRDSRSVPGALARGSGRFSRTTIPSAASGWARRESGSSCRGSRRPQANLERLSELIAANAEDERCELMWGSPGTILAGRELGLDVTASVDWLRNARDPDGLWTQELYGQTRASSVRRTGSRGVRSRSTIRPASRRRCAATLSRRTASSTGPALAGQPLDAAGDGRIRTQWCHGAPGIVATLAPFPRRGPRGRGRRVDVACRAAAQGRKPLPRDGRERLRLPGAGRANRRRTLARAGARVRDACCRARWSRAASEFGQGRYSLWTGDPGTALYLADCVDGGGRVPLPR